MPLTDLFNPTFFMFLGILLLVVALLVVYFENKMRDQNHKIASMLSLVSTLAEDMNGVKLGMNHLARTTFQAPLDPLNTAFISSDDNKLITVSDDENDSDFDDEDASLESDEEDANSVAESVSTFEINDNDNGETSDEGESSEDDDLSSHNDVKVLKLNISRGDEDEEYEENENLDDLEELDDQEDLDDTLSERSNLEITEYVEEPSELMENLENLNEVPTISASDLKTININLEEQSIDYKKLPLTKLRSIVAEKSLSSDASKLKKNELLKLLGAE
jgi:hypothetical protein